MKRLALLQGSDEWRAARRFGRNASEAPAMMGASKKVKRTELLHMKATGTEKEYSDWVQEHLFDRGHEIEAAARPIAEDIIGDDLFPVSASSDDGYLNCSYDGLTMDGSDAWECKSWNEAKAADVREGRVPEEDRWQVVQQLAVGAKRVLYMVTDGTPERTVHCWLTLDPADEKALRAGWKQFDEDRDNYVEVPAVAAPVAAPVASLPAITYRLNGLALTSNLDEYRAAAEQLVEESRRELETDQDFADAEARIKAFSAAETRLKSVAEQVLGEIHDVAEFSRQLGDIGEMIRQARLNSERQVKARKENLRAEARQQGEAELQAHIAKIDGQLAAHSVRLPRIAADFAGAIKGKRTLASLRDAVSTELARAKIAANDIADRIRTNLAALDQWGGKHPHLWADKQQLVLREPEDLVELVKARVIGYEAEEAKKREAERERIRQEEAARLEREQREREERANQAAQQQPSRDEDPAFNEVTTGDLLAQAEYFDAEASKAAPHPAPSGLGQLQRPAKAAPVKATRPTDAQIVEVLALHYRVHESTVLQWLQDFDHSAAGDRVAANF